MGSNPHENINIVLRLSFFKIGHLSQKIHVINFVDRTILVLNKFLVERFFYVDIKGLKLIVEKTTKISSRDLSIFIWLLILFSHF